ncbi:hypothetical protein TraAM80_06064 [Trypanosoma rangeli]|uniref:Calponin-homology (CH) domain-containing protein n=1 Tax=Trypanosoma rangeli TaxID=5698 RepID=A0A3R7KB79_TRYRA|nr:uncharacterized protein TraAM80_06064 [Trypanosoma rangeli]RNF03058.1 hypothetical protein TraAM80_06064 [Trypanosoma rangeli]|eukprot:RNF03058.1 hypothetical protein TraAM80_06064 [Trypanosoma rangeli]
MTTTHTEFDGGESQGLHRICNTSVGDHFDGTTMTCAARVATPQGGPNDGSSYCSVAHLPDEAPSHQMGATVLETDVGRQSQSSEVRQCSGSDAPRHVLPQCMGESRAPDGSSENTSPSVSLNASLGPPKRLCAGPTRAAVDAIMAEECREWVAKVVGAAYNTEVLREANFVDALRSGVVLLVLLQKLRDPPVPDESLQVPKRTTGFYARDNVVTFLEKAAAAYHLVEAQLFTDSDLCDGKNDRAVVTCLLAIARIAYARGSTKLAPAMIVYEQEIDAKWKNVSQQQIDELIREAEASEVESEEPPAADEGQYVGNCAVETSTGRLQLTSIVYEAPTGMLSAVNAKGGEEGGTCEEVPIDLGEGATAPSVPEETMATTTMATMVTTGEPSVDVEGKTIGVVNAALLAKTREKKGGTVFYLRGGAIGKNLRELRTAPVPVSTSKKTPTVSAKLEGQPKPGKPESNARKVNLSVVPKYYPRRGDEIDMRLSVILNTHFVHCPHSPIRFRRLSANSGEYVVYHRITGHKRLVLARILQGRLMIRQSGSITSGAPAWEELRSWLTRYEKEF